MKKYFPFKIVITQLRSLHNLYFCTWLKHFSRLLTSATNFFRLGERAVHQDMTTTNERESEGGSCAKLERSHLIAAKKKFALIVTFSPHQRSFALLPVQKRAGEIPISSAQHFSKTHLDPKSNGWKREIITIIWFAIYVNIQHVNSNSRDHLKFSQQCRRFGYMFRLIKSSFSSTLFGCVVTFLLFFFEISTRVCFCAKTTWRGERLSTRSNTFIEEGMKIDYKLVGSRVMKCERQKKTSRSDKIKLWISTRIEFEFFSLSLDRWYHTYILSSIDLISISTWSGKIFRYKLVPPLMWVRLDVWDLMDSRERSLSLVVLRPVWRRWSVSKFIRYLISITRHDAFALENSFFWLIHGSRGGGSAWPLKRKCLWRLLPLSLHHVLKLN